MGERAFGPRKRGTRLPPFFEILSHKRRKKNKCIVYTSLNKLIVFVSHCFEQTFINVSNWKLPLRLRFPHLPIFKCRRRRAHCEKPGAAAFLILLWKCLDKRQFANDFFDFKLKTNPKQIYHVYTENTDFKDYKVRF